MQLTLEGILGAGVTSTPLTVDDSRAAGEQ
jgi:hypothetical protein